MSKNIAAPSRLRPFARHHHHVVFTYSNQKYVPGKSHTGLQNNANNTVHVLRQNGIHATGIGVDNANGLRAFLNTNWQSISHVIVQAVWIKSTDLQNIVQAFPSIEFAVVVHSGYAFLEDERNVIPKLYSYMDLAAQVPNLVVASNSAGMCEDLAAERGQPVTYLPNLYPIDPNLIPIPRPYNGGPIRAGLFCSPRPGKNMTTQAAAFGIVCRQLKQQGTLFYNVGRNDGGPNSPTNRILASMNDAVAGNPYVTTKSQPWTPMPQHITVVGSMNINLQCSTSETHNLVACDSVTQGVPVVTSSAIKWAPSSWQADPDSARDIARVAISLMYGPTSAVDGVRALQQFNARGLDAWESYILSHVVNVGAQAWPAPQVPRAVQGRYPRFGMPAAA